MPTIFSKGPYRFFFYSGDRSEPRHIHVEREDKMAKFWIDPVRLHSSGGFDARELRRIQELVRKHQNKLQEAWDAFFKR